MNTTITTGPTWADTVHDLPNSPGFSRLPGCWADLLLHISAAQQGTDGLPWGKWAPCDQERYRELTDNPGLYSPATVATLQGRSVTRLLEILQAGGDAPPLNLLRRAAVACMQVRSGYTAVPRELLNTPDFTEKN